MTSVDESVIKRAIEQIDAALNRWEDLAKFNKVSDYHGSYYYSMENVQEQEIVTILSSTIERLAPQHSRYRNDLVHISQLHFRQGTEFIDKLAGILKALRVDYEAGYIQTVQELIHANIFSDFLEMAEHLLESGYKDAAAVIVGSVLESHLRTLCLKHGVKIDYQDNSGNVRAKPASRLNADLVKANVYTKSDQKDVDAWQGTRNDAAHGDYTKYTKEKVDLMLQGVRLFMRQFPA